MCREHVTCSYSSRRGEKQSTGLINLPDQPPILLARWSVLESYPQERENLHGVLAMRFCGPSQERVRLVPPEVPHEVIDPLPYKPRKPRVDLPNNVVRIEPPSPVKPPIAQAATSTDEWKAWCSFVADSCQ